MELLLLQFSNIILPPITRLATEGNEASRVPIGYIVLAVIVGPVLLLTIAAIIELPKKTRIPELFLGAFVLLISAMVAGFAAISFVLKFFVPQ